MLRAVRRLRRFVRVFWSSLAIFLVVLAVLVTLGRKALPLVADYREPIARELSERLGVQVRIGKIDAVWRGFRPRLTLRQVEATNVEGVFIVSAAAIDTQIDLPSLLWDWRLAFRKLQFTGLKAGFVQSAEGRWAVNGLPFSSAKQNNFSIKDPLDIFLFGRRIQLLDAQFDLHFHTGHSTQVTLPNISLENDDNFHRLAAAFSVDNDQKALSFVVEGRGDPRNEEGFSAQGYLQLERFPMEKVVAATAIAAWQHLDSGRWSDGSRIDLKLWFDGNLAKGFNLSGQFSADELPLKLPAGMVLPQRTHANLLGSWEGEKGWQLKFGQLQFDWATVSSPPVNLAIGGKLGEPLELDVDKLDLAAWTAVAQQAGAGNPVLAALQPQGELHAVKIRMTSEEEGYFKLDANLRQVGLGSFRGSPEIRQVDGYITTTGFGGTLDLDSQQGFSMFYPTVYREPLAYTSAKGQLRWELDRDHNNQVLVSSSRLSLRGDEGSAEGHLYLELPTVKTATAEPLMFLVVGLTNSTAAYHHKYVPFVADPRLLAWLDKSIKQGNLLEGGFIYRGSLLKKPLTSRSIQLYLNVADGELKFDPRWPELSQVNARLIMDDMRLQVDVSSAQLAGNSLSDTQVSLVREEGLALQINGKMTGTSENAQRLLLNSPIKELVGDGLNQLELRGDLTGAVNLRVPLAAGGAASQQVDIVLQDNQLKLEGLGLTLERLHGELHYSHQRGLYSPGLSAHLWGNPLNATIESAPGEPQTGTQIKFKGPMAVSHLQSWLKRPEFSYSKGQALVTGTILLPNAQHKAPLRVELASDLKGITFDLPPPFAKSATDTLPFTGTILIDKTQQDLYQFNFGHLANLGFTRDLSGLTGLALSLAEAPAAPVTPGKIKVKAKVPHADLAAWQPFVLGYVALTSAQPSTPGNVLPVELNLELGRGDWGEMNWQPLALRASQKGGGWEFGLHTPMAGGTLVFNQTGVRDRLHLDFLNLPEDPARKNDDGKCTPYNTSGANLLPPSNIAKFDPALMPLLDVELAKITLGDKYFGHLQFVLEPITNGAMAKNIRGQVYGMALEGFNHLGARLVWTKQASGHYTAFDGRLRAGNLSDVLKQMGEPDSISSNRAIFDNHLSWPGAPDQGGLANMSGFIQMDVQTGRFNQNASAGSNPLLKLISFLNFDNLARRLRFDFADLNPQGMAFDALRGRLDFNAGDLFFAEPLQVSSASTHIQLAGNINVATQQLDANLVATLPISGNLTLAAAMTGALPVAAGVYLAGKVFKKQMDKASSLRYRVRGPWLDPELSLQSVFDDQTVQEVKPTPLKPLKAKKAK